jgi:SAM-dependent methyltransferase
MERMPPVTGSSAEPAGQAVATDYDSFAEVYSAENEVSLLNAYYERPATLALAGDVAGRRILDAGCGSGPLSAALRDRGAIVTGFDSSAGMLELARQLGQRRRPVLQVVQHEGPVLTSSSGLPSCRCVSGAPPSCRIRLQAFRSKAAQPAGTPDPVRQP